MLGIEVLLFDLDGTILDSKKSIIDAVYKTTNYFVPGKFSYGEIESRFGESWDSFIHLLKGINEDEIFEVYMKFVKENHEALVVPFPGVREYLLTLRDRGHKLAVVTNKQACLAVRELELWGLDHLFETITTIDDVSEGKPHPEPIEKTCKQLNASKRQAMMIGDTVFDAEAALNAGVKCTIIDWYKTYPLEQFPPEYYFNNMEEFIRHYENYKRSIKDPA